MLRLSFAAAGLFFVSFLFSCKKEKSDNEIEHRTEVFSAAGEINNKMDDFRGLLGPLNTTLNASNGRREINWDGVPDGLIHQQLPPDFFNPTGNDAPIARQRGLAYSATGNFQVSNSGFAQLNGNAGSQFSAFSGNKVFANVSNAQWEIKFQKPGQLTPASIRGFGAVFSDVDLDSSTSVEFFNGRQSLGKFFVPKKAGSQNFSFLGVYFPDDKITEVRIAHNGKLADNTKDITDGGTDDLVVLDDFIYSEPKE